MDVLFCLQIDFAIVLFSFSLSSSSNNEIRCGAHMDVALFVYMYTYETAALFFNIFCHGQNSRYMHMHICKKKKERREKESVRFLHTVS